MYTIKRMSEFDEWLASLRDGMLIVMLGGGRQVHTVGRHRPRHCIEPNPDGVTDHEPQNQSR